MRSAPVLAVVLLLAASTVARADDVAAAASAREHYQKATSYYDLGKYAEAIKEFEAAYEIKNDPALLYNLAQSNRLAGNPEQALHFYRTYLRYVPHPANRVEIDDRIKQLEILLQQKNATQVTPPNQTIAPGATSPPPSAEPAPTPPPPIAPLPSAAPEQAPLPPPEAEPAPEVTKTEASVAAVDPTRGARFETYAKYGYIASGALVAIGLIEGAVAASASSDLQNDAKAGKSYDPSTQSRGQSAQAAEAFFIIAGLLGAGGSTALYLYGNHLEHQVSAAPLASSTGVGGSLRVTF
ncbi:MAG TPA: tetratricopeptide repeat protein [Polyangia bacterium]|nr:tetratricopeptide repeat protein [Polyangia bacterium]